MGGVQMFAVALLLGLLGIAVVNDLRNHRIPNLLVLLGVVLGVVGQSYASGLIGLGHALLGMLVGFAIFLPMYAVGGMAAGDVKLMAMVGAFLTPYDALWAAFFSLIAGGACGLLIVLLRGQALQTLGRYWLMLRARAYFSPAADEVAGKPFPYSIAVLLGTLTSVFWLPFGH
ncbi:A24 family peptidase [Pseudomonas sp. CCI3.1]|uniref:A24 family peptidase n=1 Tax=Pseudomonas sp. CCI3.1 TaxID=3048618 RepID=UPI002AB47998|nr:MULTISPECIES: prepilin peptidase [unclassified Pseudomonas]MDY7581649.1 prepilin peptidase [Pseudomonas sp. CCI3.1]MEB0065318.1 prepilin peptidase [Pseudomonas sp. CCI3.1]MEB0070498.1 prepilin peptidase [Pseudomonas sp. CCI1.4]